MSGFVRIKRSTFRIGAILLYAFFLSLIAYVFVPQILTPPKPREKSLRCEAATLYVGLARAAGENCTTKCTDWAPADCDGFSACFNKNISCTNGIDQDGRPCQGCCFDCTVECEPVDEPPSISGSISCSQWGNNGWCIGSASLDLNVSDPQGYSLKVTGNAGGNSISCNGDCSINLPSGSGTANFVVTASESGMSDSGSASWDSDPESPNLGLSINGSTGKNGWYTSSVAITPTGSDSISGLAGAFISVNGGAWQTSATLGDGEYNINATAADRAGNIVDTSTTISVDSTTPSISVRVNGKLGKNSWYTSDVTISASASDSTSGIASFEVSVDGNSYRSYSSPIKFSEGRHTVRFRATDRAGNSTESSSQTIHIDKSSPTVSLITTDVSDGTIAYKAHDGESGLAYIYLTVEDNNGNYPKVKWSDSVSGKNVTGEYNWNGKLQDGTSALPGEYNVWIKAVDQAGHEDTQAGTIVILEGGALSTTSASSQDPFPSSINAPEIDEPNDEDISEDMTYGGVTTEPAEIENHSFSLSANASTGSKNSFPWQLIVGATTVAAGATAAKVLAKPKKKKSKPKRSEEQKARTRARLLAELEVKWAAQAQFKKASKDKLYSVKMGRQEAEEDIKWQKTVVARQKAEEKARKDAELKAGLAAYYNARKQGEKESTPKPNWWEQTKSAISENILQPFDTYIYEPFIEPATEVAKEVISDGIEWADENIYKPYIDPIVVQTKEFLSSAATKINENVIQPYVLPWVEEKINESVEIISQINTNIVQPYVVPALEAVYDEFYKPYVEPIVETAKEKIEEGVSWINETIYQPYIQPITDYLDEHIYEPFLKPVVDDIKNVWSKYGEWVHGSLDAAGLIPGFGEIADALNGLVYLGEGRYIEAGVSLLAMIPILGDLGKAGKWGLKAGQELVEEVGEKIVKEVVEEGLEKAAKETTEEVVEKTVKETTEEIVENAAKETTEEVVEKTVKETATEFSEKALKEIGENVAEKTTKELAEEVGEKATKEVVSSTSSTTAKTVSTEVVEETAEEALEQASGVTPQFIKSLEEKYGKEMVEKFLPFCEKYGINPYDVLTRPPAEGQTLIGWGLGIEDVSNPANHPLMQLNLTKDELNNILEKSIVNPNSKVVVLGYGSNVARPYYKLGEDIKGCYLSLSKEAWAPFDKARANFWIDINAPFLEKAIEDRKVFLFNIESDVINDPLNIERFSLPELHLIEMAKNNYVEVPVKEGYTAFVPVELLETYMDHLPVDLL